MEVADVEDAVLEGLGVIFVADAKTLSLSSFDKYSKTDFFGVGSGSSPNISPLSEAVRVFVFGFASSEGFDSDVGLTNL